MTCPPPGCLFVRTSRCYTKQWKKRFFAFADAPLPLESLTTVHDKRDNGCARKRKSGKKAASECTPPDGVACEQLRRSLAIAAASGSGILASYRPSDLQNPVDLIDVRDIVDITLASKSSGKRHAFVVHTASRKLLLAAGSEKDLECWIRAVQTQVREAKEKNVEATDLFKTNSKLVSQLICGTKTSSATTAEGEALEASVAGPSEIEPEKAAAESDETVEMAAPIDSPSEEKDVAEISSIENAAVEDADAAHDRKCEASESLEGPHSVALGDNDGSMESSSKDEEVTESSSLKSAVVQDPAACGADDSADQAVEGAEANTAEPNSARKDGGDGSPGASKLFVAISSLLKGKSPGRGQQIPDDVIAEAEEGPDDRTPSEAKRASSGAVPLTADIVQAEETISRILEEIVDAAVGNATTETAASPSASPARVKKELFRLYVPIWARRRSSTPLAAVA